MEFRQFRINFISRKFESQYSSDKKTSKFIKTNKHIGALTETSLPLKKIETFEMPYEKNKTARGT